MRLVYLIFLILLTNPIVSQNTVGLLEYEDSKWSEGYNLFYPNHQSTVYLMNNCGEIVQQWEDFNPDDRPGTMAYFNSKGQLLKAKTTDFKQATFGAGGAGGIIELLSWDNQLINRFELADSIFRQHHELEILPNDNVLFIAWEKIEMERLIENGFDSVSNNQPELWFDCIFELNANLDSIVWEWHAFDHIIQEHDDTKLNYGVVAENPEKFNINYQDFSFGRSDWMHSNALDYNHLTDQVMLSVRNFHEIWVIDHSTSSQEAAVDTGGLCQKGGDILYRWGNPAAYHQGGVEHQKLFYQHDCNWQLQSDSEYFNDIYIFNSGTNDMLSEGVIIKPELEDDCKYNQSLGSYLPENFLKMIAHPNPEDGHSTNASSIQLLPNGNVLLCAARQGRAFELTASNELVWEYIVPLKFGANVPQGVKLSLSDNFTNQFYRYPLDFVGFEGKEFIEDPFYLELEPNLSFCDIELNTPGSEASARPKIFPNPANNYLTITELDQPQVTGKILDLQGQVLYSGMITNEQDQIDISFLKPGLYLFQIEGSNQRLKFIKL